MTFGLAFFVLNFIVYATLALTLFSITSKKDSVIFKKISKFARNIVSGCTTFSVISFILEIANVIDLSGYRFVSVVGIILGAVTFAVVTLKDKIPAKFIETAYFALRLLTVSIGLEIFVFNINSAHLLGKEYKVKTLNPAQAYVENFDVNTGKNAYGGHSSLEFKALNIPVGTIEIDGMSDKRSLTTFHFDITDETNSGSYRINPAWADVIYKNERSQNVPCNFSGKLYDLRISFDTESDEYVEIKSITLNKPIMLRFSIVRFLMLYVTAFFIYALSSKRIFFRAYSECKKDSKNCIWFITVILIAVSLFVTSMFRITDPEHSLEKDFKSESGNQITQELVDSLKNGKTTIDIPINDELVNLDNPYDWSQRDDIGYYPWDHLLYEGEYYSYYGIAPVIMLFLPYHLITDYYFPSVWAVWLFGVLGIFFLTKFYLCFADKFFKKIPASLILIGFIIMQMSTGVFLCYFTPNFYEIAQNSGFLFTTAGAYFLISSNVIGDGKIKNYRIALAAFCLSMGVLSRPTLAIYAIASLLFIYAGFKKKKASYEKGSKAKYYSPYFCCALLPFVILGSVQMLYNYARFGNPFDFGIQYSLTINDFTRAEYHTHFVAIGFFNYLFTLPSFKEAFPFFESGYPLNFNQQGYYFIATGAALGMLWRALPIIGYSKFRQAYNLSDSKDKKLYSLMIFTVCIACPFAVMFSIWESGFAARYCVDFAWQFILGALIICFIVYDKCNSSLKKHLNNLMIFSGVVSVIMNFIQVYSYIEPTNNFIVACQAKVLEFGRLFEFWR